MIYIFIFKVLGINAQATFGVKKLFSDPPVLSSDEGLKIRI
jgi:hypothetical protein